MADNTTPVRFRRHGRVRLVRVAEQAETWTTPSGSTMVAQPGDMIITDPEGGIRSVTPDSFTSTYKQVEGDVYERTGEVWARPAQPGERVATQEGEDVAGEGQWLVTDDDGNSWFVPEDVFTAGYRLALTSDQEAAEEALTQAWAEETLAAFGIDPEDTAADLAAGREEAAIVDLLENEHPWVCAALRLDAYDLAIEWVHRHPGITTSEVAALIEAGEYDPHTATR